MVDKDFYLNELNILDWMTNENIQIIRFKDRLEYKENNQLHRIDGHAVEYFSADKENLYYIKGKKLSTDEFKVVSKTEKLTQL